MSLTFTFLCLSPAYQPFVRSCVSRTFPFLCLSPAYQPFVRSCRERRVCPSFSCFYVSHRRTSPLCGLVGRDVCVPFFPLSVSPVYTVFPRLDARATIYFSPAYVGLLFEGGFYLKGATITSRAS